MDDLIQILVFAVTFIIFVASAIMKQKKKPNGNQSSVGSFVDSLFGIPETQQQPVSNAYVEEYFEEEVIPEEQPKKVEKTYEEGVRSITSKYAEKDLQQLEEEDKEEAFTFDARQAIINSEIINRKYF